MNDITNSSGTGKFPSETENYQILEYPFRFWNRRKSIKGTCKNSFWNRAYISKIETIIP